MNWFSALVLYILIWWVTLFAVLPIGTQAVQEADEATGWRGAPAAPRMWRKLGLTTLVATVIWGGAVALIVSDVISFRHGFMAMHQDRGF